MEPNTLDSIQIRLATLDEILPLRYEVLIVGTDRTEATLTGDDDPRTIHFAGFDAGRCVGCVSLMPSEYNGAAAYQLRGMAVDPAYQGMGLGAALLSRCESAVTIPMMWCNARQHAIGFYERHGWQTLGEMFEITGVGPHIRMIRQLG